MCVSFPPPSSSASPCHTKVNCAFPKAVLVLAPLPQPPRIRIFGLAMSVQFCQVCAEKENIGVTYETQLLPRVMLSLTSVWCCLHSDVLKWHKATVRGHLWICPSCLHSALPSMFPRGLQQDKSRFMCKCSWRGLKAFIIARFVAFPISRTVIFSYWGLMQIRRHYIMLLVKYCWYKMLCAAVTGD